MFIAIAQEKNQVFNHFGKTPSFHIVQIKDGQIQSEKDVDTSMYHGKEHIDYLQSLQVDTIICGEIGPKPYDYAKECHMDVIAGTSGPINEVIKNYLQGDLKHSEKAIHCCHHCQH